MTKISVIMPVYNTKEEWLREAIESILNQTYKDFEFIIADDGSEEYIENIVNSYKNNEIRIKYLKLKHSGLTATLNAALDEAQGEYIARMDSDDISYPNRFKIQVEFLDNNSKYSIMGSSIEIFGTQNGIWRYPQTPKYFDFIKGCFIAHPTVMLRREDFKKYNLKYKEGIECEDYELWSRAIRLLNFYNLNKPLLKYRIHGKNLSLNPKIQDATLLVRNQMLDFLTNNEKEKEKILNIIYNNKLNFLEKLFSIKNTYINGYKQKFVYILGNKFEIK